MKSILTNNTGTVKNIGIIMGLIAYTAVWIVIAPFVGMALPVITKIASLFLPTAVLPVDELKQTYILCAPFLLLALYSIVSMRFLKAALFFITFLGMALSAFIVNECLLDATYQRIFTFF